MESGSFWNLNKFIEYEKTDKLCDSIAKLISEEFSTGFFIKLKVDSEELPFFCTTQHGLDINTKTIQLILNKKKENGKNYKINLNLNDEKRIIKYCDRQYDTVFIQILPEDIPENITLSFLDLEQSYINNPTKFNNFPAIIAGYPKKYIEKQKDVNIPFISSGRIVKIKDEIKVVYNMETDVGSSGSPICIINENNELKLLAIHVAHNYEEEKDDYNEGILLWYALKNLRDKNQGNSMSINVKNEFNEVENLVKYLSDKFDILYNKENAINSKKENENQIILYIPTEIFKYNFLTKDDYKLINFYQQQILAEYKNRNQERFDAYFNLLNNHILIHAHEELGDSMNKILTIFSDFQDIRSTYNMISSFNNEILVSFNKILLSKDYKLKVKLIYFISMYIQTITEMNCAYNFREVIFYKRTVMKLKDLLDLQGKIDKIITFKYFIKDLIPTTYINSWYKFYYDIKHSLLIGYSKTMKNFGASDYDTSIVIEQEQDKQITNCFKISNWPEIIIAPFAFFRVEKIEIDNYNQTADIKLILLGKTEKKKKVEK